MPPIEVGSTSATGAINGRLARPTGPSEAKPSGAKPGVPSLSAWAESPVVEASSALDPGAAPIDAERVAEIRRAVANGTYPVIPTQIADAMIAAGVLLASHRE